MKCCAHVSQPYEDVLAQRCGLCVGHIPAADSSRIMEAADSQEMSTMAVVATAAESEVM